MTSDTPKPQPPMTRAVKRFQVPFGWMRFALWSVFFVSILSTGFGYWHMRHAKNHVGFVISLNNSAQLLRQSVSASMLDQAGEMSHLEEEITHFRYQLLRTKSFILGEDDIDMRPVLISADSFVEDIDNLMATVYSSATVTRRLKELIDSDRNGKYSGLFHKISSYLLFELHGLNDKTGKRADVRFSEQLSQLNAEFQLNEAKELENEIYMLFSVLERFDNQMENLDQVTNHAFVRSMTRQQEYWSLRVLYFVEFTLVSAFIVMLSLLAQLFLMSKQNTKPDHQLIVSESKGHFEDPLQRGCEDIDVDTVEKNDALVFESHILAEQLDHDYEAVEAVLTMFIAEHQGDGQELQQLIQNGQEDQALRMVHSLKGVSANIGAGKLEQICLSMEHAMRAGEDISEPELYQLQDLLAVTIQTVISELDQLHLAPANLAE